MTRLEMHRICQPTMLRLTTTGVMHLSRLELLRMVAECGGYARLTRRCAFDDSPTDSMHRKSDDAFNAKAAG